MLSKIAKLSTAGGSTGREEERHRPSIKANISGEFTAADAHSNTVDEESQVVMMTPRSVCVCGGGGYYILTPAACHGQVLMSVLEFSSCQKLTMRGFPLVWKNKNGIKKNTLLVFFIVLSFGNRTCDCLVPFLWFYQTSFHKTSDYFYRWTDSSASQLIGLIFFFFGTLRSSVFANTTDTMFFGTTVKMLFRYFHLECRVHLFQTTETLV